MAGQRSSVAAAGSVSEVAMFSYPQATAPMLFPRFALPPILLNAASQLQNDLKVPMEAIVSAQLATLSLVSQGRIRVRKRPGLVSPCSLWFVVIQGSGERKSSLLNAVLESVRTYQHRHDTIYREQMAKFETAMVAWNAEKKAIVSMIQKRTSSGQHNDDLVVQLGNVDQWKPEKPKRLKLVHEDFTPEALIKNLSDGYPMTSIISDEGGVVTKGKSSSLSDLGLLNKLWDGGTISIDRRGEGEITVENAALTMGLYIQEEVFQEFLKKKGTYAREIGFLARTMIINPLPMAGTRTLGNSYASDGKAIEDFSKKVMEILQGNFQGGKDPMASMTELHFSPDAQDYWDQTHDEIEEQIRCGIFFHFRDFGSKLADNIARLAAILHFIESQEVEISKKSVEQAVAIFKWYANEYLRVMSEWFQPKDKKDAESLHRWLSELARKAGHLKFKKNDVLQYGPVREKARLNAALSVLWNAGKLNENKEGRTTFLQLNPQHYSTPLPQVIAQPYLWQGGRL